MITWVLVGNPDAENGMSREEWESNCEQVFKQGFVNTTWSMNPNSSPAEQVIVMRTGHIRGIIGFGNRREGNCTLVDGRRECPIRLFNMRSLNDDPFVTRNTMEEMGAWRRDHTGDFTNYFNNQTQLKDELAAVEKCCVKLLGVSLATMCSTPFAEGLVDDPLVQGVGRDEADQELGAIQARADLSPSAKAQLIYARVGQGVFRGRVRNIERSCRVTDVSAPEHLRASHIKPWRVSTDREKLDGANGLLLAPHIDQLFDRGYITFGDDGSLIISGKLVPEILKKWSLSVYAERRPFSLHQKKYLAFHRRHVFNDGNAP